MANFGERYQMIRRLGAGGMGEVWLAHDELLDNRPVAIKIMRAHMSPVGEDAARFDREMRLASHMQHPNIVYVFTTGTSNNAPYMVMEYLEGHNLSEVPPAGSIDQVVTIARETCSALEYAHQENVIHRDIKPGNLFLCKTGQTKVLDFGIAKAMSGTKLSSSGVLVGTFAYMSPEQWRGEPAAFSNDIWATGCVLYEFLSGRPPRVYATVGEYAAAAARSEPIPDLRSIARVPGWLGGAVMAMLEPDPGSRPTAAQCQLLLSGAPAGSWLTASPPVRPGPATAQTAAGTATAQLHPGGSFGPGQPNPPATWPGGHPEGGAGGPGRGGGPVRPRRSRGRVFAVIIGVAVVLLAGAYAGHALLGSPAGNSASGGGTPPSTHSAAPPSHKASASASASGSASGTVTPAATGTATLTGVTTQVNAGAAPSFTYTTSDVGSGESVVLQRTYGQAYKDLETLSGTSGSVTAPVLDTMGAYSFRVVIESDSTDVSASAPVTVYAYGNVSLVPFNNGSGTVQVGNRLFSYTDLVDAAVYPQYEQNPAWTSSTCRSLTMVFAGNVYVQQNNETVYLEFVQTKSDPVYTSDPPGAVKSITVALDGGPLYINASSTLDNAIVFTATGSCYTPSGQPAS